MLIRNNITKLNVIVHDILKDWWIARVESSFNTNLLNCDYDILKKFSYLLREVK
jgi:hypothetical protein